MSKTSRRLTTAIVSALLGGALAVGNGIGWDVAPASVSASGSVVSNGIGWD
ncbi:hypothetical protein MTF65_10195 [Streptomyces sp. APSN-46.1]|uniref:hypothetical protein n=1 Tax=Streptomyces sp. APSN-46.1 TaxID=2929049 RepID=UPI001FB2B278|nr:hypothetical protein [Streptomyces sp. APSN-46.1]MCJ1677702.1 hypothetical protein [Streptomyces sp. APSN-46.1]